MGHAWFRGFDGPAFAARRLAAPFALDGGAPAPPRRAPPATAAARGGRRPGAAAVAAVAVPRGDPALVRSFPLALPPGGVRAHALRAPLA